MILPRISVTNKLRIFIDLQEINIRSVKSVGIFSG